MTIELLDTIATGIVAAITIGSFLIGTGYMLWKEM